MQLTCRHRRAAVGRVSRRAILALLAVTALAAAACGSDAAAGSRTTTPATNAEPVRAADGLGAGQSLDELCRDQFADAEPVDGMRVGLITDSGSIDDGTFNLYAYEGMAAAARCFGFEAGYTSPGAKDNYGDHLHKLVDDGVDAVVTVGYWLGEVTHAAAREHPETRFIGIDQVTDGSLDNYATVAFRNDQAGFLAGAAAGLLTRSDIVGVVAGPDSVEPVVQLAEGFAAGVSSVAADVQVLVEHLDSFVDPDRGGEVAEDFLAQGADVVYGPAGLTGAGGIAAAAAGGAWVIGVDQDQYFTTFEGGLIDGAHRLVTSTIKRVDLGVFLTLADVARGTFEAGPVVLDASGGGVAYAPAHDAELPAGVEQRLQEVADSLVAVDGAALQEAGE